jgi:diketogulonate reductase-like aldo/keto reductase
VDTIDLLQLHHPNPAIPIGDTMDAVAGLIEAGKVRFGGVSNFAVTELRDAQNAFGKHPIVSNQVRYNILDRTIESGLLAYCQTRGIAVIAYSPLARSLNRIMDCDPAGIIHGIVRETGRTPAQIVINWCLCKDGVFAIPKGGSLKHIMENCAASDWRLTPAQVGLLDTKVHYRRHNRFDRLARQWVPHSLQRIAVRVSNYLPRSVRRRII